MTGISQKRIRNLSVDAVCYKNDPSGFQVLCRIEEKCGLTRIGVVPQAVVKCVVELFV